MTKPTKWHVRPAKTLISLDICPVWSKSSLCAQWVAKDPRFLHADSGDSDQTGRMPRLIWVFTGGTCHFVGFVTMQLKLFLLQLKGYPPTERCRAKYVGGECCRPLWPITWSYTVPRGLRVRCVRNSSYTRVAIKDTCTEYIMLWLEWYDDNLV